MSAILRTIMRWVPSRSMYYNCLMHSEPHAPLSAESQRKRPNQEQQEAGHCSCSCVVTAQRPVAVPDQAKLLQMGGRDARTHHAPPDHTSFRPPLCHLIV
jgi:hypothetical protein